MLCSNWCLKDVWKKPGIALLAFQAEWDDIEHLVLQNRMALDLILASQGGVCKVGALECWTCISDSSGAHHVIVDTELWGLKNDTRITGGTPPPGGCIREMAGPWSSSLISGVVGIGGVFFIGLPLVLIIAMVQAGVKVKARANDVMYWICVSYITHAILYLLYCKESFSNIVV